MSIIPRRNACEWYWTTTPEQILEPEALLRKLVPEGKFKPDEIGFDIKVIKAAWSNARPEEFLTDALIARCRPWGTGQIRDIHRFGGKTKNRFLKHCG